MASILISFITTKDGYLMPLCLLSAVFITAVNNDLHVYRLPWYTQSTLVKPQINGVSVNGRRHLNHSCFVIYYLSFQCRFFRVLCYYWGEGKYIICCFTILLYICAAWAYTIILVKFHLPYKNWMIFFSKHCLYTGHKWCLKTHPYGWGH